MDEVRTVEVVNRWMCKRFEEIVDDENNVSHKHRNREARLDNIQYVKQVLGRIGTHGAFTVRGHVLVVLGFRTASERT